MNEFLFEQADFKKVMKKHCYEVLQLLISKSEHFQIVCDTRFVSYEPKLPDSYIDSSLSYIMFYISDHSVESVNLNDKLMSFYAGFGPDNFTTCVTVKLEALHKIQIQRDIVFINPSYYHNEEAEDPLKSSIEMLLKNAKNRDLIKK